jgi:hypothetical protein
MKGQTHKKKEEWIPADIMKTYKKLNKKKPWVNPTANTGEQIKHNLEYEIEITP